MSQDKKYDNKNEVAVWQYTEDDKKYHLSGSGNLEACPHCQKEIEMWANGWINQGQNNRPLVKLIIKPKRPKTEANDDNDTNSSADPFAALNLEKDIPF